MNDEDLILFSRGFSNLYEDGKVLLTYLVKNGSYVGTMTELAAACGRPRIMKGRKVVIDLYAQFRRLGILKLRECGALVYEPVKNVGYEFKLVSDWKQCICWLGGQNLSRSAKYRERKAI